MIRKMTRSSEKATDMSAEALRKKLLANAAYLDRDAVEFVMKKLDSKAFDPNILKL